MKNCTSHLRQQLSLNLVLLVIIVLRKLLTPITLGSAYIHNKTVKVLQVYIHPLISANWFIISRPCILTRRKKKMLLSIFHNKGTRVRNKAILFSFNRPGSPNSKTADIWQRGMSQTTEDESNRAMPRYSRTDKINVIR